MKCEGCFHLQNRLGDQLKPIGARWCLVHQTWIPFGSSSCSCRNKPMTEIAAVRQSEMEASLPPAPQCKRKKKKRRNLWLPKHYRPSDGQRCCGLCSGAKSVTYQGSGHTRLHCLRHTWAIVAADGLCDDFETKQKIATEITEATEEKNIHHEETKEHEEK